MPVIVEIQLSADEFTLGQVLRDRFVPYFWIEHRTPSEVEPARRDHSQVQVVSRYDHRAGRTLYELEWSTPLDEATRRGGEPAYV